MIQTANQSRTGAFMVVLAFGAGLCATRPAVASELWTWSLEGEGHGTARVFDGGPVVTASSVATPLSPAVFFAATDFTRVGARGATYSTGGESDVRINGDALTVVVKFDTTYIGGFTSQDDHTGGEGGGSLWSVIELVMPADELIWLTRLIIHDTAFFSGDTFIKFENVTQGTTLLELTSPTVFTETRTLIGNTGDVIRISSQINGEGFFPATVTVGTFHSYDASLDAVFIVPEPATLLSLILGLSLISRRRR
ncbi:MAG: PEP-CTERM sorting domain-containing protein [Phycisphaerales bacterium]|nr:PEP-CTERM sorting domain-containing protein [Phycisphaerales bacterium]